MTVRQNLVGAKASVGRGGNGFRERFLAIGIFLGVKLRQEISFLNWELHTEYLGQPGTYDALSHILFTPLPTSGSSGGPIVDEVSGAVIGIMLGTRTDNSVEGTRGWGVPAESIYAVSL